VTCDRRLERLDALRFDLSDYCGCLTGLFCRNFIGNIALDIDPMRTGNEATLVHRPPCILLDRPLQLDRFEQTKRSNIVTDAAFERSMFLSIPGYECCWKPLGQQLDYGAGGSTSRLIGCFAHDVRPRHAVVSGSSTILDD
jgi:hypothetical protein